jgi:DNA-binding NtrC family response regulator
MQALDLLGRYAKTPHPILLVGERGVGKTTVAKHAHALSSVATGPFITANAATLRGDTSLATLFGAERGAFTGAVATRKGRFELADQGTLFLDEVGELTLETQGDLLGIVETGCARTIGGREYRVQARLITGTNRALPDMVARGAFRADLLDRLGTHIVRIPPLRERREDIHALVAHLLARAGEPSEVVAAGGIELLAAQPWPGNIRQLDRVLINAACQYQGVPLGMADIERILDTDSRETGFGTAFQDAPSRKRGRPKKEIDLEAIRLLRKIGLSVDEIAKQLKISRSRLYACPARREALRIS